MDVVRPVQGGIQGLGRIGVVVARGNEHRAWNLPQGLGQGLGGLPVGLPPVQQVAGEEHQAGLPLPGKLGQAGQELPLLPPPLGGLVRGQAGEGAVQVEVGPVDEFDHWVVFFPGGLASERVWRWGFAACGRRVTFWTARKSTKNRRGTAQDGHYVSIFALPIPSGLRPSPLDKGSRPPDPRFTGAAN